MSFRPRSVETDNTTLKSDEHPSTFVTMIEFPRPVGKVAKLAGDAVKLEASPFKFTGNVQFKLVPLNDLPEFAELRPDITFAQTQRLILGYSTWMADNPDEVVYLRTLRWIQSRHEYDEASNEPARIGNKWYAPKTSAFLDCPSKVVGIDCDRPVETSADRVRLMHSTRTELIEAIPELEDAALMDCPSSSMLVLQPNGQPAVNKFGMHFYTWADKPHLAHERLRLAKWNKKLPDWVDGKVWHASREWFVAAPTLSRELVDQGYSVADVAINLSAEEGSFKPNLSKDEVQAVNDTVKAASETGWFACNDDRAAVVAHLDLREVFKAAKYKKNGHRYESPKQESGTPAVCLIDTDQRTVWFSFSDSDAESGIGRRTSQGCWGDALDIAEKFMNANMNRLLDAASRAYINEAAKVFIDDKFKAADADTKGFLSKFVGSDFSDFWQSTCVTGSRSAVVTFINRNGDVVSQSLSPDASRRMTKMRDNFFNAASLRLEALRRSVADGNNQTIENIELDLKKQLRVVFRDAISSYRNARDVKFTGSPFVDQGTARWSDDSIEYLFPLYKVTPQLEGGANVSDFDEDLIQAVVEDFREHWPGFDDFVSLVLKSRFASQRKNSYVYLQAVSNFGKGILRHCFEACGVCISLSMEDIEKIGTGAPMGLTPATFMRHWVVWVDEAKRLKSEIKLFENSVQVNEKNSSVFTADVYSKVITSAEPLRALLGGEAGIEQQFINRFSYFNGGGKPISSRPMFKELGQLVYKSCLVIHVSRAINNLIEQSHEMAEREFIEQCQHDVNEIYENHCIGHSFENIEEGAMVDVLEETRQRILSVAIGKIMGQIVGSGWAYEENKQSAIEDGISPAKFNTLWSAIEPYIQLSSKKSEKDAVKRDKANLKTAIENDCVFIKVTKAGNLVDDVIDDMFDRSTASSVRYKKDAIIAQLNDEELKGKQADVRGGRFNRKGFKISSKEGERCSFKGYHMQLDGEHLKELHSLLFGVAKPKRPKLR